MKKRITHIAAIIGMLSLTSCATMKMDKNIANIQSGMTKSEVIKLWGNPDLRSFNQDGECITYKSLDDWGTRYKLVNVIFNSDTVVAMNTEYIPNVPVAGHPHGNGPHHGH